MNDAASMFGDIALVWSWEAFLAAAIAGFMFGYFVIASVLAQAKWRTGNGPLVVGWLVFVMGLAYTLVQDFSQTMSGILAEDPDWPRILSRIGPHICMAVFTGIGATIGLGRAESGGLPQRIADALESKQEDHE